MFLSAEHIDALPTGWEEDGFFRVTAEQFQEHMVLENAIRFGIPVLVTTLGTEFEEKHFKRKALRSLVEDQNKLVSIWLLLLQDCLHVLCILCI